MAEMTALSAKHEKFAQLVAKGALQIDAYRKVTSSKATPAAAAVSASRMAAKCSLRIESLRAAAQGKASDALTYGWEEAMAELNEAQAKASADGKHESVMAAIRQKCKISGLETEDRKNTRPPFEGQTDAELVDGMNRDLTEAGYTLQ